MKETKLEIAYSAKTVNDYTKVSKAQRQELESYYQEFADSWCENKGIGKIDIQFNGRIKNTLGRFNQKRSLLTGEHTEYIELGLQQVLLDAKFNTDYVLDTLVHELTHWEIAFYGGDSRDGSREFERALAINKAASSGTTPKSKQLSKKKLCWYQLVDIYQMTDKATGKPIAKYPVEHTNKEKWQGQASTWLRVNGIRANAKRIGFKINYVEQG